ncbi:PREDICTED: COMM domain-containing protein 7 isoform X9 [Cercocebus atys]|uniref:COMM domain-containing protein 7 isoform X9 n=1 Tax=Cercocebus atys TaxID=9531 RepID=UPI0005F45C17|nr:PREDICTED: COMM domain-containing protein 7 isoform X9 [Cercocebus atys]
MGRLHCTEDPVPEAVGGDMQQLNQLSAQQFSALTEVLFHFLTEPKEVERFLAQLSEFATTNRISLGSLRSIVKSLLLVPNGALKKSLTAKQVQADFITLGLSEEKATYFSEKLKLVVKKGNQTENVYIENLLHSSLSVLYYDQLPIKNCLEVLSQKRKKKSSAWKLIFLDDSVELETFI